MWSRIKVRKHVLAELHRRILLEKAYIGACNRELAKIDNMRYYAYQVTWICMLDHYQELLTLQRNVYGCNLFWVLTGKRWLLTGMLLKYLTKLKQVVYWK